MRRRRVALSVLAVLVAISAFGPRREFQRAMAVKKAATTTAKKAATKTATKVDKKETKAKGRKTAAAKARESGLVGPRPRPSVKPIRPPPRPLGPPLERVKIPQGSPYSKELRLLQHVFRTARKGSPQSVCEAIEHFGEGVLGGKSQWLKVAGGGKAGILSAAIQGAPPGGQILEIGTYCGFSSSLISTVVPGVHIATLEVDPVHVVIARNVHNFGGVAFQVDVWTGHSKDLLPRITGRYGGNNQLKFSAVFFDQKGSRYDEDMTALEKLRLLWPGSMLIADNVLKPGAPVFLYKLFAPGGDYKGQLVSMKEFAMPSEDWMSISVKRFEPEQKADEEAAARIIEEEKAAIARKKERAEAGEEEDERDWKPAPKYVPPEKTPEELVQLERETDRMRERATGPGRSVTFQEWAAFAEDVRLRMAEHGVIVTATQVDHMRRVDE